MKNILFLFLGRANWSRSRWRRSSQWNGQSRRDRRAMRPAGAGTPPCTGTTPRGDTPTSPRSTTRAPSGSDTSPAAPSTPSPNPPPVTSRTRVAHYRPLVGGGTRTRSRRRGSWTGLRSGWGPWACHRKNTSTAQTACTMCPGTYRSLRKYESVRKKYRTKSKVKWSKTFCNFIRNPWR